jgi:hypothetical protein
MVRASGCEEFYPFDRCGMTAIYCLAMRILATIASRRLRLGLGSDFGYPLRVEEGRSYSALRGRNDVR